MNFDRSLDAPYGVEVRLSPLVSRILAPNPSAFTFKGTGTYILGAGAEAMVIDPGPDLPQHIAALERALAGRQIRHILITHTHRDHCPAAAPLKAWSGAKTYGLPLRPSHLSGATGTSPARAGGEPWLSGEGAADEAHDHGFVPDVRVTDGMRIAAEDFEVTCVATPGHTANHMCYALAREKALFSGDHVMGWSTSVIAPPDGDMGQYLASLDRLAARDDAIFYPTHGSPIREPRRWLQELIAHRRLREAQVLDAVQDAAAIPAIVEKLYPGIDIALRGAAVLQTAAHLAHLRQRGLVTEKAGQWFRSGTG